MRRGVEHAARGPRRGSGTGSSQPSVEFRILAENASGGVSEIVSGLRYQVDHGGGSKLLWRNAESLRALAERFDLGLGKLDGQEHLQRIAEVALPRELRRCACCLVDSRVDRTLRNCSPGPQSHHSTRCWVTIRRKREEATCVTRSPSLASGLPLNGHATADKRQARLLFSVRPDLDVAEPTCRAHRVLELAEGAISTGLIGPQSKQTVEMGN